MRRFDSLYSHGFARIAAAVPHLKPADPEFNTDRTIALAEQASERHAAVVVFPELGISAYAIDDLLHQSALLDGVELGLARLVEASQDLFSVLVVGVQGENLSQLAIVSLVGAATAMLMIASQGLYRSRVCAVRAVEISRLGRAAAVSAVVAAGGGASLDGVLAAAEEAWHVRKL